MEQTSVAIAILWFFVFIYAILGSIDFGAGFWAFIYGNRADTRAASIANRFLSPSWKVTNVFLVLLVVALVGFFPRATFLLGTLLLLPVSLVLILLTVRSTFLVYAYSSEKYSGALKVVSGVTGLLIPGLLLSVLPVTLGGFILVEGGYPQLMLGKLFTSPTLYAHVAFGICAELFISALFLSDYAREAEDETTYQTYRNIAIVIGPISLATAVLATFAMNPEAHWMVVNMNANRMWFILSLIAFFIAYSALWWRRRDGRLGHPRVAFTGTILQYALASIGYGSAHMPYIVYPHLTVAEGFTNPSMFNSLLIGYSVGTIILIPLFYWFWRLFMKDKRYLKQE